MVVVSDDQIDFAHDVVPILKRHCVTCHGGRESEGDFSINSRETIINSGAAAAGDIRSRVLELVRSQDPDDQMPPEDRPRLKPQEIQTLTRWIQKGLPWEPGFSFHISGYEPPLLPRTPQLPPAKGGRNHPVDRILDDYLAKQKLQRPAEVSDSVFLRRVYLDLVGLLPTPDQIQQFQADPNRERLIDRLLADDLAYAEHWLTFFNDLLRNDYSGTGFITKGRRQISGWLYKALLENKPFDQFTRELIAPPTDESRGYIDGIKWRGEVSAGQTIPIQFSQSVAQSFLGINLKCASCHDSFIDRWTLKEAYGLAAIYADGPLSLHRCDKPTGETQQAAWLFPEIGQIDPTAPRNDRLAQLANLMTHPKNGRFPRTIVNRLWYRLMGRGIVHPLDAMQSKPWNEDLLDYLANEFVQSGYDLKAVLRLIATSAAYQSQTDVVPEEQDSQHYVYRGPRARRMTAEQLLDAIWQLTGSAPRKHEAPVQRPRPGGKNEKANVKLGAKWIWGPLKNGNTPDGESVLLRTEIQLATIPKSAGVFVTCDNGYRLIINGREAVKGNDWTSPQTQDISKSLRKGSNQIVVIATNAGSTPNPAGLYLDARIQLPDESIVTVHSGGHWEFHAEVPRGKSLEFPKTGWQPATLMNELVPWRDLIAKAAPTSLAEILAGNTAGPMVRASLMKNTALMRSLGRPGREQIVSMRPTHFTTLEAIDLANQPDLSAAFAKGAENLVGQYPGDTRGLVAHLFSSALSRQPAKAELVAIQEALGEDPSAEAVQDLMWAICMLPEFLLIR